MLTNPTIDMLRELGLYGMATAFQELDAQSEVRGLERGEWLAGSEAILSVMLGIYPNLRWLDDGLPRSGILIRGLVKSTYGPAVRIRSRREREADAVTEV
jgi:hypothetical protein